MAPIQFGILMVPYQSLDVAGPLDVLSSCSKALIAPLEAAGFPDTSGLASKAIDIEFHHINETMDPVTLTSGFRVLPTTTCDDCPPLDYLLIGGPDPVSYRISDRFIDFICSHVQAGSGLFTTCTGALAIAPSGVLDGKMATTNHGALEMAEKRFPKVIWTKQQWVVDGKFWTAGGACAGMDMMASWVVQNYGLEVATHAIVGFAMLDFEPRDIHGNRVLLAEQGDLTK